MMFKHGTLLACSVVVLPILSMSCCCLISSISNPYMFCWAFSFFLSNCWTSQLASVLVSLIFSLSFYQFSLALILASSCCSSWFLSLIIAPPPWPSRPNGSSVNGAFFLKHGHIFCIKPLFCFLGEVDPYGKLFSYLSFLLSGSYSFVSIRLLSFSFYVFYFYIALFDSLLSLDELRLVFYLFIFKKLNYKNRVLII